MAAKVWQGTAPVGYRPVQRGFICATTVGVATLVGASFSTGLLLIAARAGTGGTADQIGAVPAGVRNTAVIVVIALFAAFLAVAVLTLVTRAMASLFVPAVIADYGRGGASGAPVRVSAPAQIMPIQRRRTQIARHWATSFKSGLFTAATNSR